MICLSGTHIPVREHTRARTFSVELSWPLLLPYVTLQASDHCIDPFHRNSTCGDDINNLHWVV